MTKTRKSDTNPFFHSNTTKQKKTSKENKRQDTQVHVDYLG